MADRCACCQQPLQLIERVAQATCCGPCFHQCGTHDPRPITPQLLETSMALKESDYLKGQVFPATSVDDFAARWLSTLEGKARVWVKRGMFRHRIIAQADVCRRFTVEVEEVRADPKVPQSVRQVVVKRSNDRFSPRAVSALQFCCLFLCLVLPSVLISLLVGAPSVFGLGIIGIFLAARFGEMLVADKTRPSWLPLVWRSLQHLQATTPSADVAPALVEAAPPVA